MKEEEKREVKGVKRSIECRGGGQKDGKKREEHKQEKSKGRKGNMK